MDTYKGKVPSKSIKEVPGRSKLRVESSNPIPTWNPIPKTSKLKLISPEEAIKLSSGGIKMAVSETPRPSKPTPSPTFKVPRPKPLPVHLTPQAPRHVRPRLTSQAPKPVRNEIVCGLQALSMTTTTVRQRPKQQAANATTQVVKNRFLFSLGSNEICQSRLSELLLYRPALHPIWKGRIVDSSRMTEFDCEFCAKPASNITWNALKLSKLMPAVLKVELLPTRHISNDVFINRRSPRLSDVDIYLFPDDKKTQKFKGEHEHLLDAMVTRNAMIKANINGTELLIFSSILLDKISQYFIKTQKKTEYFLWGCFLRTKNSQAPLLPGTDVVTPSFDFKMIAESQSSLSSSQMEMDVEDSVPPGFENPTRSPGNMNKELSVPPGFENIWTENLTYIWNKKL